MSQLEFAVVFHNAAIPSGGTGREGVDISMFRPEPIGGDRLKGLMRDTAENLLSIPSRLTDAVFGTVAAPSPWNWTAPREAPVGTGPEWKLSARHRVRIDPATDAADHGSIASAHHVWRPRWNFSIHQKSDLAPEDLADHQLVLRVSALATKHLGLWRRRGYGWIGITDASGDITRDELEHVLDWRRP
ncbi:hypothetical protein [Aeromicrobium duanguangcaii]|uniref:hypothetical protein n=1 Tax=Aeromicrobium duanguangcaii TaxID=2968086 RepID=UPI002016C383|nr:hypothetical protein [Aeromicrobium duanguangcaii]MCL3836880.1 hypothetical protein [Aeromicrobium duanguangcaii]